MKKRLTIFISGILLLALTLAGCGGSGGGSNNPDGDPPVTPSAELSGYVYSSVDSDGNPTMKVSMKNDGTAIVRTDIKLIISTDRSSKSSKSYNVKTDENGYFSISIPSLADGTYYVVVIESENTVIYTVTIQSGKTITWSKVTTGT